METISIQKPATRPEKAAELPTKNRQARPNRQLHGPGCQVGGRSMGASSVGSVLELPAGTDAVLLRRKAPQPGAHSLSHSDGSQDAEPRRWAMGEHQSPGTHTLRSQGERFFCETTCSYTPLPSQNNPHLPFWLCGHWMFTFIHQHLMSPNTPQGTIFWVAVSQDLIATCSPFQHTHLYVCLFKDILPAEVQGTTRTSLSCTTALNWNLLLSSSYICCNCSSPS